MNESELSSQLVITPPVDSEDHGQLLRRHIDGDTEAFADLVQHFKGGVYTYLIRCRVDEASRDDLFQEIFLRVHRAAASYDPIRPFAPWLFTIVANTVRSYHRRKKAQFVSFEEKLEELSKSSAQDHLESKELLKWLDGAVQKLPPEQREALLLCTVGELEQSEAARILGIPVNTVKTYIRRARISLAKDLARRKAKIQHEVTR